MAAGGVALAPLLLWFTVPAYHAPGDFGAGWGAVPISVSTEGDSPLGGDFLGQTPVVFRSVRVRRVLEDRLPEARRSARRMLRQCGSPCDPRRLPSQQFAGQIEKIHREGNLRRKNKIPQSGSPAAENIREADVDRKDRLREFGR